MAKKICKGSEEYHDVAHYAISEFLEYERAQILIDEGKAMFYLSGVIHRSFHSSTSKYHTIYRQKNRMNHLEEQTYHEIDDSYDYHRDIVIDQINKILDRCTNIDMYGKDSHLWYISNLFKSYVDHGNYSEISRLTGIPRTSISSAVNEFKIYIKEELKKAGITWDI